MSQPSEQKPTQHDAPATAEAFKNAEGQLASGNEGRNEQALKDASVIENKGASSQPAAPSDSDAVTEGLADAKADDDEEVDRALEAKAREEGVAAADDTARIVTDLTPHNL